MRQLARGFLLLALALGLLPVSLALAASPQTSADFAVCNAANRQESPRIISDGAGGAIVTWEDNRSGNYNIYAQHVLASGAVDPAWPANGVPLCDSPGDGVNPVIVSDGAGGAIVAWQDHLNTVDFDLYAQHLLASGVVDPAWPANGSVLTGGLKDQRNPAIVSDGAGGAIVTWEDYRNDATFNVNPDICAQRILASGVVAWTPYYGNVVCNNGSDQVAPAIVSDGAGGAIIVWKDYRIQPEYESQGQAYVQHVLSSGVVDPGWTANGTVLGNSLSGLSNPTIVSDGAGGAIVTWADGSSSLPSNGFDIYAQHVLASGVADPAWTPYGTLLCNAVSTQAKPTIVSDGVGGAIVTWEDHRSGLPDIYAHHVLSSGVVDPGWTANGTLLCNAANAQFNPTIVSDGVGGAIITWHDRRSGTNYDIYAQHVLASGVVDAAWTANGTLLCDAVNDQSNPMIVSVGTGGAIVTWQDFRTGNWDVHATLLPGEVLDVPPGTVSEALALGPAKPNPVRNGAEFRFALPREGTVSMTLFDQQGRRVRELVSGVVPAGDHVARWDGRDRAGRTVPTGVYFVRLEAHGRTLNQRFAAIH